MEKRIPSSQSSKPALMNYMKSDQHYEDVLYQHFKGRCTHPIQPTIKTIKLCRATYPPSRMYLHHCSSKAHATNLLCMSHPALLVCSCDRRTCKHVCHVSFSHEPPDVSRSWSIKPQTTPPKAVSSPSYTRVLRPINELPT